MLENIRELKLQNIIKSDKFAIRYMRFVYVKTDQISDLAETIPFQSI